MKVLNKFQQLFDSVVIPFIEQNVVEDGFLKPLFYTLRQESNKFRSATTLISAKICGGEYEDVLPIAAAEEILHSAIIIQDDIADDSLIRRGNEAAWKKYGICFSLHSSLYVIPECLRLLSQLHFEQTESIIQNFWKSYQDVYRGQINQDQLQLSTEISYADFLEVHLQKTALGRWAITAPAIMYGNQEYAKKFSIFAEKLGDAGSLKNDTEDFLHDDGHESFCTDIRTGNLTYPIYLYFSRCSSRERKEFISIFGKDKAVDYSEIRKGIIEKGIVEHCLEEIQRLVAESIDLLSNLPESKEKKMLEAWAKNHLVKP